MIKSLYAPMLRSWLVSSFQSGIGITGVYLRFLELFSTVFLNTTVFGEGTVLLFASCHPNLEIDEYHSGDLVSNLKTRANQLPKGTV